MTAYSLAKACDGCIRGKKRCDRALPRCNRCTARGKPCLYKNEPLTRPGRICKSTRGVLVPDTVPTRTSHVRHTMRSELNCHRLDGPVPDCEINLMDVVYMIDKLRRYPLMSAEKGGNAFIHPRLYKKFRKPYFLALIDRLCIENVALLKSGVDCQPDFLATAIESVLGTQPRLVSFLDCLAFVQALVTIQILTILSSSLSNEQRQAAESRQKLLAWWSEKLWSIAPAELPRNLSPCDAYILAETVRRTMLVSYALQAVYCVISSGTFIHTVFGSALPFDANVESWETDCHEGCCKHSSDTIDLISYRQYVERYEAGHVRSLTQFEKMLLVGCQGVASVESGVELPPSPRS